MFITRAYKDIFHPHLCVSACTVLVGVKQTLIPEIVVYFEPYRQNENIKTTSMSLQHFSSVPAWFHIRAYARISGLTVSSKAVCGEPLSAGHERIFLEPLIKKRVHTFMRHHPRIWINWHVSVSHPESLGIEGHCGQCMFERYAHWTQESALFCVWNGLWSFRITCENKWDNFECCQPQCLSRISRPQYVWVGEVVGCVCFWLNKKKVARRFLARFRHFSRSKSCVFAYPRVF